MHRYAARGDHHLHYAYWYRNPMDDAVVTVGDPVFRGGVLTVITMRHGVWIISGGENASTGL